MKTQPDFADPQRPGGFDPRILWALLSVAALWRLMFWMPYYVPGDTFNYLNALDIFQAPLLGQPLHIVRLGMVLPLAFLRWLSGDWHYFSTLYALAASLGTCYLVFVLANRWRGANAGYLACAIIALVPMEVVYGTMLVPDTPLDFYSIAAFWCLATAARERINHRAFYAGVLIGLAYTCKVTGLFFAPVALLHVFWPKREIKPAVALLAGLGAVLLFEHLILYLLMGELHVRIIETLAFIPGDKGQFIHVEKTPLWWLGQIGFKMGALFWGGHPPTAVLLTVMPHLVLVAFWRSLRKGLPQGAGWVLAWGGVWIGQQMLISAIEPEPRYLQVALPYCAILIGIALGPIWTGWRPIWRGGIAMVACALSFVGSSIFWLSFSHTGEVTMALADRFEEIVPQKERMLLGGPSVDIMRLAHYRGLTTELCPGEQYDLTHWARIGNGYTQAMDKKKPPPQDMQLVFRSEAVTPWPIVFEVLNYTPRIGLSSFAELYIQPELVGDMASQGL